MGRTHNPASLCRCCIHQRYCMERNQRGACAEYRTDQEARVGYRYWWRPVRWWELKKERKK